MIQDNVRFYPLATTYFELEHSGGECHFVYEGDDQDVRFALHPVVSGEKVGESVYEWRIGDEPVWTLELPAGDYWVMGALPMMASNSQKIDFCLGNECVLPTNEEGETEVEDVEPKSGCQTLRVGETLWYMGLCALLIVRRRQL